MTLIRFIHFENDVGVTSYILVYVLKQIVPHLDHPHVTFCIRVFKAKAISTVRLVCVVLANLCSKV